MLLYVNDILADDKVQDMDDEQFAWYMRMILRAWRKDEFPHLENVDEELRRAAGCKDRATWAAKKDGVMICWQVSECGRFVTQKKQMAEFERMCLISEKKKAAGSRGGKANAKQNEADAKQMLDSAQAKGSDFKTLKTLETKDLKKEQERVAALPSWLPLTEWEAFLEMRKKAKKPLTEHAKDLAVKKLDELRAKGHSPPRVLNQSVMNGWLGLFELKDTPQSFATAAAVKPKSATEAIRQREQHTDTTGSSRDGTDGPRGDPAG